MLLEEWKRIIIDDEVWDYEVSTHGNVRNLKGHYMTQFDNGRGYLQVHLTKNKQSRHCLVHRVVAQAFIPNPENKPTVNHLNEDKHDNRVENLEWATSKEQATHGTLQQRLSEKKEKKVRCIETNTIYDSVQQASEDATKSNIVSCCRGRRKTTCGFHWEYVV